MISISPTQNVGSEKPKIDPAMIVFETGLCGRSPAYSPSGMPMSTIRTTAASMSSSEIGILGQIRSATGTPLRVLVPQSQVRMSASQCSHRMTTLSSRWYSSMRALSRPPAGSSKGISRPRKPPGNDSSIATNTASVAARNVITRRWM